MNKKFPHYHQLDSMDCGPACLKIILSHYNDEIPIQILRNKCNISREGVSLANISAAANSLGYATTGVKLTFEELCNSELLPSIIHWNQKHFIVVYKIVQKRNKKLVYISDPAIGLIQYSEQEFLKSWITADEKGTKNCNMTGIALLITPPQIRPNRNMKSNLNFKWIIDYIVEHRKIFIQLLIGLLIGCIISLILPLLTQTIIDFGISTHNLDFIIIILIAQIILGLGQLANDLICSWLMLHMTSRISISIVSDFLNRLMRLPIRFFDSKRTGDILQRIGDHGRIQTFLTSSLLSIIMSSTILLIYSTILWSYSKNIILVFTIGSFLYIGWIILFLRYRRKIDYMRFQEVSNNQSSIIEIIEGMQEIKLNNYEKMKLKGWERIQARLYKINIKGLEIGQIQQIGGNFLEQTKNLLISFIAARSVINGDLTLGMMTALQFILGQLNNPISSIIKFIQETQDTKISLERLNEIHNEDTNDQTKDKYIYDIPQNADITLQNVTFHYNDSEPTPIIDDLSLIIPQNKTTAIVGASGSGKTTLLKLILGVYKPCSGKVLIGNAPLEDYHPEAWRKVCGIVLQDGFIFSDTILNNICLSDDSDNIDIKKVTEAIEISNIKNFIDNLPSGLNTKIGADGVKVSSGEKQRILIARAIYKNAKYIFLDEATNSLDTNNETTIMSNISTHLKNKTIIIVAHRLSTVINADNIIVLSNGKIAEQGTHNELIQSHGIYYKLTRNQLKINE